MRGILSHISDIYDNSLFLEDLFAFLELESHIKEPSQPAPVPRTFRKGIRFENVSFHYPGSQRFVVKDFDLDVPAGKIAAIVGANGAGKTTLIKLLNRFYDPQNGSIYIDDIDLRNFNVQDLRRRITIMFQEPVQLYTTARENISFGDLKINPDEIEIKRAADEAGLGPIIEKLPQNYDTLLGKFFEGGTDLSVGEWQRIALARAFYRNAPIILLDEPTSAMDPWAEVDWLKRFRTLAKNRTAIIITHRFTTAAFADTIHVMDEGQIVESGQHEQLISSGGRYAKSWIDQMGKWFPISPVED
jgi:ATP-binding cassette subfamily B protein